MYVVCHMVHSESTVYWGIESIKPCQSASLSRLTIVPRKYGLTLVYERIVNLDCIEEPVPSRSL